MLKLTYGNILQHIDELIERTLPSTIKFTGPLQIDEALSKFKKASCRFHSYASLSGLLNN